MENTLMNRDKMEQLLETHSDEEVSRILQEYGYPAFSLAGPGGAWTRPSSTSAGTSGRTWNRVCPIPGIWTSSG